MKPLFWLWVFFLVSLGVVVRADRLIQVCNKPWRCKYASESHLVKLPEKLNNVLIPQWEILLCPEIFNWFQSEVRDMIHQTRWWGLHCFKREAVLYCGARVNVDEREEETGALCNFQNVIPLVLLSFPFFSSWCRWVLTRPRQTVSVCLQPLSHLCFKNTCESWTSSRQSERSQTGFCYTVTVDLVLV